MSTPRAAGTHVLVVLACATIALAGVWLLRDVIAPLAVALVVVVICSPASSALVRRGWPRGLGVTAIILLAYSVLLTMGALVWIAGVQFVDLLGDLSPGGDFTHVASQLDSWAALGTGAPSSDSGDAARIVVVIVYCVVNVVLQVFVQPAFVSDAVGLSVTLSFFAVVFWTVIIGPVGALLAVPLTLLARTLLLEGSDDTLWLRWVSGDRGARPSPETRDRHVVRRIPWDSRRVRRWSR